MEKTELDHLHRKYDFHWEMVDVIIGGKSLLDSNAGLSGFPMQNLEDADRFMRSYGFEWNDPIQSAEAFGNFHEALNFIRENFLHPSNPDGLKIDIPRKILEITDTRDLLLMANRSYPGQMNDSQGENLRNWACSVLKVVHTIAHLDKDVRSVYFSEIQTQILDKFYKIVHRDSSEQLYLGTSENDPLRIPLFAFETKSKKSRESLLVKLLHKPESTAEEVFDRVGMRFTTYSKRDALRLVKYLKDEMVLMPVNIKPSRSRNTLLDVPRFRDYLNEVLENKNEEMSLKEIENQLEESIELDLTHTDNPHSSQYYRSIQFTARQLIKIHNPIYEHLKNLKKMVKVTPVSDEFQTTVDRMDLKYVQREIRFFYPYEIQIVDQKSAEENEKGRSAHAEYKKAQIKTAMRRVMGSLMNGAG